jgi:hypothetical protein
MSTERERAPRVEPRWFIRAAWVVHRGFCVAGLQV